MKRNLLRIASLISLALVSLSCWRGDSGPQPIEGVYHSDQVGDLKILKGGTFIQTVEGVTLHGTWWVENNRLHFVDICLPDPRNNGKAVELFSTDPPDSNGYIWIFEDMDWRFTRVRSLSNSD